MVVAGGLVDLPYKRPLSPFSWPLTEADRQAARGRLTRRGETSAARHDVQCTKRGQLSGRTDKCTRMG